MQMCEYLATTRNINGGSSLVLFLKCHVLPELPLWFIILCPTWNSCTGTETWSFGFFSLAFPSSYTTSNAENLQTNQSILKQDLQSAVPHSCPLGGDESWRCSVPGQSGLGQGRWENPTKANTPGGSGISLSRVRWWRHDSGKEGVTDHSLAKENNELAGGTSSM